MCKTDQVFARSNRRLHLWRYGTNWSYWGAVRRHSARCGNRMKRRCDCTNFRKETEHSHGGSDCSLCILEASLEQGYMRRDIALTKKCCTIGALAN